MGLTWYKVRDQRGRMRNTLMTSQLSSANQLEGGETVDCEVSSPPWPVEVVPQAAFDLVVGQEGHVARVCHCQLVPVPYQRPPRLKRR